MKVSIENFTNLIFQPEKRFGAVEKLIQKTLILREKLNSPEKQSFYFRNGIKSHEHTLAALEETYDTMRKIINSHTVDDFWKELVHAQEKCEKISREKYLNTIDQIALAGILRHRLTK